MDWSAPREVVNSSLGETSDNSDCGEQVKLSFNRSSNVHFVHNRRFDSIPYLSYEVVIKEDISWSS